MEESAMVNDNGFDGVIREYLSEAREKLDKELSGTREAIRLIALEKTRDFIRNMDRGLDKDERNYLSQLVVACMYQSFCYGFGIGKIEGTTNKKVYL